MTKHLKTIKSNAEKAIKNLKSLGLIDHNFRIQKYGNYVLIPIRESPELNKIEPGEWEIIDIEGLKDEEKIMPQKYSGSYDIIGDIIIMKYADPKRSVELAENLMKYRKGTKSVFIDHGIKGEFRKRSLELIAGEDKRVTTYKENGLIFKIDLDKAYFSPRLATERMLISKDVKDGEFIIDMFAGIGPFSLNIAKNKKCKIIAIDSNPDAISNLEENISLNRLAGTVIPVCGDAAVKIAEFGNADRIIMNLPHGAFMFVEKALKSLKVKGTLNYYEINTVENIEKRMEEFRALGLELVSKRVVHGYSKMESMYSLEFKKASA